MFKLKELKYSYDALEPFIDAETMELHHKKHHANYIAKLNETLKNLKIPENMTIEDILRELNPSFPIETYWDIRNNGGGALNHNIFFDCMSPKASREPQGQLKEAINKTFGSFEDFKKIFRSCAMKKFGSGWAWLLIDRRNKLFVRSSSNQDCPMYEGYRIVLCLDLWEHAYYLKYNNRKADYVDAFWNVVDWDYVSKRFEDGMKQY